MMTSKRRSRRSFGEGVVRVFAVVSARELAKALGGNGGAVVPLLRLRRRGKEARKWMRHRGSRWRAGASNAELRPDVAWPVRPSATRGATRRWGSVTGRTTVASIQRKTISLTASLYSAWYPKPWRISENHIHECCSPTYSLQFL